VWLARATGNPIVPFHMEARSFWTARSWDRTQIPKPFTTVAVCVGQPFEVAADLDDGGVEARRGDLERVLAALADRATQCAS
jgi:lysophospholipid acyltransferase (LPLAT)-like uncharacterized protein